MSAEPAPAARPSLAPYGVAAGVALLVFIVANIGLYLLLFRPFSSPQPATSEAPPAEAGAVAAVTAGANLLATPEQWTGVTGDWTFVDGGVRQNTTEGYDYLLSYGPAVVEPELSVHFRHLQGVGGGLVFNIPDPTSKNGAHLVRYMDDKTLVWGYFDGAGAYQNQGAAAVPAPGDAVHTLAVRVGPETYAITLDGTPMAQDVPLVSKAGHVGLTNAQSVVQFEAVEVAGLGAPPAAAAAAETAVTAGTLTPGTGEWTMENGVVTQGQTDAADFFASLAQVGPAYTASVDVKWPPAAEIPDAGGGLLFNMAGPTELAGAQMVRFNRDGQEVFWGYFNDKGNFQGEGGAALTLDPTQPHNLAVIVGPASFTVKVDGQVVATDRPLQRQGGHVGLIAYRGPLTFTNFQVQSN